MKTAMQELIEYIEEFTPKNKTTEGIWSKAKSLIKQEKELTLMPYGNNNGIVIYCKNCGSEFEETAEGYYPPIKYESDKHNRECRRCLTELGTFS